MITFWSSKSVENRFQNKSQTGDLGVGLEPGKSGFGNAPKKLRCSFEVRSGDSRLTQIVATLDWLLPNTKVRYSTRSSAFEGACGAKCLGTRTMCPEGTVADIRKSRVSPIYSDRRSLALSRECAQSVHYRCQKNRA